jgi:hypothetical protein
MRAKSFIQESAAKELADKLPTLKRTDYDAIDSLMQNISVKHDISGHKLHQLFVKKYGHTPDVWINKIKQRNEQVQEGDSGESEQINEFIAWAKKILHVKGEPKFTFSDDTEKAQAGHHTGVHSGNDIWVYTGNRNLIDIFRTVFHELVHQRQDELGMIKEGDSYPGSPIEAMADMLAGKYIKIYGKQHPEIFQ